MFENDLNFIGSFGDSLAPDTNNRFSRKIVRKFSEIFRKFRKSKFSETAFLTKSARNGVRNLARNVNAGPMVKISSKSDKWRRKIRTCVKIRKIRKFPYYNLRNSIKLGTVRG